MASAPGTPTAAASGGAGGAGAGPSSGGGLNISPKATVCADTVIEGDVTIGESTVIQPGVIIRAVGGPIVIGNRNIVEERVELVNPATPDGSPAPPMVIGSLNVFEVASKVHGAKVGDFNVIEPKASLLPTSVVGRGCVIAAATTVGRGVVVPDDSVHFYLSKDNRTHTMHQPACRERNVTHALQYLKVLTATGDRASYSVKKWHKVLE